MDSMQKKHAGWSVLDWKDNFLATCPFPMLPSFVFVQALCMLLGSGGARSVEMAVLEFVAAKVRDMQVRCA